MRKTMAGIVAAALAATVLVAAPAHAQEPGDPVGCIPDAPGAPPQGVVTVDGLDVTIDPSGDIDEFAIASYLIDVALMPVWYASCAAGDFADPAWCVYNIAFWASFETLNDPGNKFTQYITRDPATGQITFRGNALAADATGCV